MNDRALVFPWRLSVIAGVPLGLAFLARAVWDFAIPTANLAPRARLLTFIGFAISAAIGYAAAHRTGVAWAGAVIGAATAAIGGIVALAGPVLAAILFADQFAANSAAADALAEAFDVPLPIMLLIGTLFGTLGGMLARGVDALVTGLARRSQRY